MEVRILRVPRARFRGGRVRGGSFRDMMEGRILKASRARFRGGSVRGGSGKGSWQISLVLVFGIVGTVWLVIILIKLLRVRIAYRRSLISYTAFMLVLTFCLCIPAIVILALNPTLPVGIISIISLCLLVLPLLIWIPLAVGKSRHFHDSNEELKKVDAEQMNTTTV